MKDSPEVSRPPSVHGRLWPVSLAIVSTLVVIYPVAFNQPDSFPFSTYPMFAKPRGNPELIKLVAITTSGEHVSVPPDLLGTREVLQAKAQLNQIAQKGPKARTRYCNAVAKSVASQVELGWQELQLQRLRFDPIDYFENGRQPLQREILTTCRVQPNVEPGHTIEGDD
jgi:hypothetical protein